LSRAGVTYMTKGMVKICSPMVVRRDLSTDIRLYSNSYTNFIRRGREKKDEKDQHSHSERLVKTQKEEILKRMLYRLDMDVRRTGRSLNFELEKSVKLIELSGFCRAEQALLVLRCCGEVLVDMNRQDRAKLLGRYTAILRKNQAKFDVRHYNAILRVHLENQSNISVPDFLAEMGRAGISPNRVTFQHLVGLYCMEGNIMGATAILEHMKANSMPINAMIFINLLKGHCMNNDEKAITATLGVMLDSGLSVGPDTYTAMACSYGKAGNWSKVEEVLFKAEKENINFDDVDIFSIIQACSQGGLHQEAGRLVSKLPMRRGYFQELRNHLPQLAMSGNVKTAVDLYLSLEAKNGDETAKAGKGLFVVGSVVKSGEGVEVVLKSVMKMDEAGFSNSIQYLVQEAAYIWDSGKCEELMKRLKNERAEEYLNFDRNLIFQSLRNKLENDRDTDKIIACMNNLNMMGIFVPFTFIQWDLIPAMLDLSKELPSTTAKKLLYSSSFIKPEMVNCMLLYSLFNFGTTKEFTAATEFLLKTERFLGYLYPEKWNVPFARAYLQTNSLEELLTILYLCSREKSLGRDPEQAAGYLFKVLEYILENAPRYSPGLEPETILSAVLEKLVMHRIGVPRQVVMALKKEVKNKKTRVLLSEAEEEWNNKKAYWTGEREFKFFYSRERLHARQRENLYMRGNFKIPETREGMEEIQAIITSNGGANPALSSKLIGAYMVDGMVDKALELLRYTENIVTDFTLMQLNLLAMVRGLVDQGRVDEAIDLMEEQAKKNNRKQKVTKIFISTLMTCLEGLAKQGRDQVVLDMINNCDMSKYLIPHNRSYCVALLSIYSSKGDVTNLHEVFHSLMAKDMACPDDINNYNPLVDVHIVNGDLKAAVSEFKRIAAAYNRLPQKFNLTCHLIEQGDDEAIQDVLDTSIEVIGQAKSLYDLGFCFLILGHSAQARKLFETPGLAYDEGLIEFQCLQLRSNDKLDALEDLISMTRSIFRCDRNMMYQHLVSAYKEDPDKVSEIWLQIQEEGFPPSDSLKLEIAGALKAGGKTVPYHIPVEYVELLKSSEVYKTEKSVVDTDVKNSDKECTVNMVDEEVYIALENEDFDYVMEMVMNSFEKENTSLRCKKKAIDALTKENRIDEAAQLAVRLAQGFRDPRNITFREIYNNIIDKLDDVKKEEFCSSLSPALVQRLKMFREETALRGDREA